jgi:hypothetical protein
MDLNLNIYHLMTFSISFMIFHFHSFQTLSLFVTFFLKRTFKQIIRNFGRRKLICNLRGNQKRY